MLGNIKSSRIWVLDKSDLIEMKNIKRNFSNFSISLYFVFLFLNEDISKAEICQICVFAKGYLTAAICPPTNRRGSTGEVLAKYW